MQVTICRLWYDMALPDYNNTQYLCGSHTVISVYAKVRKFLFKVLIRRFLSKSIHLGGILKIIWNRKSKWPRKLLFKENCLIFETWNSLKLLVIIISQILLFVQRLNQLFYQTKFFNVTESNRFESSILQNFLLRFLLT